VVSEAQESEKFAFFDANAFLGPTNESAPDDCTTAQDFLQEMDRVGIQEALVYHSFSRWYCAPEGNLRLLEALEKNERLHPCWVLLPHHTGEMPPPSALVADMKKARVRAARVFPNHHLFSIEPWCFGETLAALSEAHIPLFIDFEKSHWSEALGGWREVDAVCAAFPYLRVVVVREGAAIDRLAFPLLESHRNLYLEISAYQTHLALENASQHLGAERLLFGTGMPEFAPGKPIMMVSHSLLSSRERARIAGENLRTLLGLGGNEPCL